MAFIYYLKYTTAGIHVSNTTLQVLACFAPYSLSLCLSRVSLILFHLSQNMAYATLGRGHKRTQRKQQRYIYLYIYIY